MTAERAIQLVQVLLRLPPEKQGEVERMVYEAAGLVPAGGSGEGLGDVVALLAGLRKEVAAVRKDVRGLATAGAPAREIITGPEVTGAGVSGRETRGPIYRIRQESVRRREGKYDHTEISRWRVWIGYVEVLLPECLGSEELILLIRNQAKEFAADELTEEVRKSMPGPGDGSEAAGREIVGREGSAGEVQTAGGRVGDVKERDVMWDAGQIAKCLRGMDRLRKEIQAHVEAGDVASAACLRLKTKLEEQQDLLESRARRVNGDCVPKVYQKGSFDEKAGVIGKHFRKLLNGCLRDGCRPLFDHLNDRGVLRYGVRNCYRPQPPINWEVQLLGRKKGT